MRMRILVQFIRMPFDGMPKYQSPRAAKYIGSEMTVPGIPGNLNVSVPSMVATETKKKWQG